MSKVKAKIEIHLVLDTDDYPVPADGRLSLQLKDEIQDIIESNISVEIQAIKVTRGKIKNDEEDDLRD